MVAHDSKKLTENYINFILFLTTRIHKFWGVHLCVYKLKSLRQCVIADSGIDIQTFAESFCKRKQIMCLCH